MEIRGNFGLPFHYLLIRVKNVNTGRIILKDNGKIIKEQNEVAETLNAYFTNSTNTTLDIDLSHLAVDSKLSLRNQTR